MKNNDITQIELNFSVIKDGTKVRVKGYDCHHLLDLTDTIGVVDLYSKRTGDYFIYFQGRPEIITDINSPELRELAAREALWQEEQAYYHDQFLYDDRF
jgi:hypothetical protein